MKVTVRLACLLCASFFLATCTLGGNRRDACNEGGVLFQDDFNGEQQCGWALYNQGGAITEIEDGVFRISTSQVGEIWWTNPGRNFDDVIITVQARQASGPDNNAYGIICRYQNESNFYVFLISGDGFYAAGKYESGSDRITYLTENGQYQFSEAINQGVATNQIRVGCVGNELSMAVNGIPLIEVTDPAFVAGDVGLGVSTLAAGTAVVEFDNIRVIVP